MKSINTQLESINQEINNHDTFNKLNLIFNSIRNCAKHHIIGSETYVFGSRISGLALPNSDVDLYISIGNTNITYFIEYYLKLRVYEYKKNNNND